MLLMLSGTFKPFVLIVIVLNVVMLIAIAPSNFFEHMPQPTHMELRSL